MLRDSLKGHVQFIKQIDDWKTAIVTAAKPLLEQAYIEASYQEAMIANIEKYGSYVVVAPQIAMPHSKTEDGVLKTGVSLLRLQQPVLFPGKVEVNTLMVLAANGADSHLELISEIADILVDDDKVKRLTSSSQEIEIMEILV